MARSRSSGPDGPSRRMRQGDPPPHLDDRRHLTLVVAGLGRDDGLGRERPRERALTDAHEFPIVLEAPAPFHVRRVHLAHDLPEVAVSESIRGGPLDVVVQLVLPRHRGKREPHVQIELSDVRASPERARNGGFWNIVEPLAEVRALRGERAQAILQRAVRHPSQRRHQVVPHPVSKVRLVRVRGVLSPRLRSSFQVRYQR